MIPWQIVESIGGRKRARKSADFHGKMSSCARSACKTASIVSPNNSRKKRVDHNKRKVMVTFSRNGLESSSIF